MLRMGTPSLRVHASWVVPILLALLLTFFTNTDVIGKSTPLRSPLIIGDGEGEGVIASEAKAVLALGEAKKSPLPSPSMGEGKGGDVPESAKVQVQETYGKLPLYFIQNDGQLDGKVKFYEKGNGHTTFFTKEGVYISLVSGQTPPSSIPSPLAGEGQGGGNSDLIYLNFLNANPNPEIITEGIQEGKVNYFIGNDLKKWRTNIPTYQAVIYTEIYPGIDLKFYGNNRQMEYDIIVKPGADPSQVQFAYEGIEGLRVTEEGDLEIGLKESKIVHRKPMVYQEIEGRRVPMAGEFKLLSQNVHARSVSDEVLKREFAYGFEVASYDKNIPLVIDPTIVYSTYLGGSGDEWGLAIAVDPSGNTYVTGETISSNFPTANPVQAAYGGGSDLFVTKFNAAGTALIYSTYLGGSSYDTTGRITVDASGNAFITGCTYSSNFPTASPVQPTFGGGFNDAFVTKLNAVGTALPYSTYLGGSGNDCGVSIAVDPSGNAYVTGNTNSSNFPTASPVQAALGGGYDAFVTKLNAAGAALIYSTYLGGAAWRGALAS